MMFFTHLELRNHSWNECKFYRVVVVDNQIMSSWGRCGTRGQRKVETFISHQEAKKKAYSKISSKQNKGYDYVISGEEPSFKDPLGESSSEKIEKMIQSKASLNKGHKAFEAYEEETPLRVVVFNSWHLWDKGWEWKSALKGKITKERLNVLNEEKGQLVAVISAKLASLLASPEVKTLSVVEEEHLDAVEIAAELWFSSPEGSQYSDFSSSLEAAMLLK